MDGLGAQQKQKQEKTMGSRHGWDITDKTSHANQLSEGLTDTYNRYHDRGEQSEDIARLLALPNQNVLTFNR